MDIDLTDITPFGEGRFEGQSGYSRKRKGRMPSIAYFGGGGAEEPKPTAEETALSDRARAQYQRVKDVFQPLESEAIALLDKFGIGQRKDVISGRAGADIAQQEQNLQESKARSLREAGAAVGSDRAASSMDAAQNVIASAKNKAAIDSGMAAQESVDKERMGLINLGRDMSSDTTAAMTSAAGRAVQRGLSEFQNEQIKDNATRSAIGAVAGTAAAKYLGSTDEQGFFDNWFESPVKKKQNSPVPDMAMDTSRINPNIGTA